MAVTITRGPKVVFGVPSEIKPIVDAPEGRQRLRFRNRDVACLFIKTPGGIRKFHIEERDGKWIPCFEQARNLRITAGFSKDTTSATSVAAFAAADEWGKVARASLLKAEQAIADQKFGSVESYLRSAAQAAANELNLRRLITTL